MKLVMPDTRPRLIKRWEAVRGGQDFRNNGSFRSLTMVKRGLRFYQNNFRGFSP
jgi:hypothetical protein